MESLFKEVAEYQNKAALLEGGREVVLTVEGEDVENNMAVIGAGRFRFVSLIRVPTGSRLIVRASELDGLLQSPPKLEGVYFFRDNLVYRLPVTETQVIAP